MSATPCSAGRRAAGFEFDINAALQFENRGMNSFKTLCFILAVSVSFPPSGRAGDTIKTAPTPIISKTLAPNWLDPKTGQPIWPNNNGFTNPPVEEMLPKGDLVDRYGAPTGRFLSPINTPYVERSLPYIKSSDPYHVYIVTKSFGVEAGPTQPWFGEAGGALQFMTFTPIKSLLAAHELREVGVPAGKPTP
jgi:hypothetical protein